MFRKWSLVCLCVFLVFGVLHGTLWSSPAKKRVAVHRTPLAHSAKARLRAKVKWSKGILIRGGEIWTATGTIFKNGELLIRGGKIIAVGKKVKAPGARVIDARGKYITPGLIDTHSHMGVYASPHVRATSDGNESARPVTGYAWAERGFWPQDPAIPRAAAGGATTAQILPGSANLIGGRSVVVKLRVRRSVDEMKFPHAPYGLKMACGENPKRVHRGLRTRMGSYAGYRKAFQKTREYMRRWKRYHRSVSLWKQQKAESAKCWTQQKAAQQKAAQQKAAQQKAAQQKAAQQKAAQQVPTSSPKQAPTSGPAKGSRKGRVRTQRCKKFTRLKPSPPALDHGMETLKLTLEGKILVHIHCYRADEMLGMLKLSKEFGFKIRSFHHATDAYKIRDILAKEKIAVSVWADWWGFKLEAFDAIQEGAAMSAASGVRVAIHSDSSLGIQRLNHEAAKAFYRGRAMGLNLKYDDAIRWITINPAWALGIQKYTGSLEPGKMADIVIWDGHPFKVRTRTHTVFIDGEVVFQRGRPLSQTDFEVGLQQQR